MVLTQMRLIQSIASKLLRMWHGRRCCATRHPRAQSTEHTQFNWSAHRCYSFSGKNVSMMDTQITYDFSIDRTKWKHFSHFDCDISKELCAHWRMWVCWVFFRFICCFSLSFFSRKSRFLNSSRKESNWFFDLWISMMYICCVCTYRSAPLRKMKNDFQNIIEMVIFWTWTAHDMKFWNDWICLCVFFSFYIKIFYWFWIDVYMAMVGNGLEIGERISYKKKPS